VRFIRFVISHRHLEPAACNGTLRLAYRLRGASVATRADRSALAEALNWFEGNIGTPARPRGYRRHTRGVSWFKDTAVDHLARMHEIRRVLERYGHQVEMLTEARVGEVVYEDEYQVVAKPVTD